MFQALGHRGFLACSQQWVEWMREQRDAAEAGRILAEWSSGPSYSVRDVVDSDVVSEIISSSGKLIFCVSESLPFNSDNFSQPQCKAQSVLGKASA